jgi:hypothetical protein
MGTKANLLLVIGASLALTLPVSAPAEDTFVPCMRLGRIKKCIAVPLTDSRDDQAAKTFQPPTNGKSRIYIIRPYTLEPREKTELFLDGQFVAHMAPLTYVVLDVSPGQHHIKVRTGDDAEIQLNVRSAELYYITYRLNLLFNTVRGEMTVLDEKAGQSEVLKSKRAISVFDKN